MTYALTFMAGVAVAAVLMWYYAGLIVRKKQPDEVRLHTTTAYVYSAMIRAGRDPLGCQHESIMLAKSLNRRIDLEAGK